MDELQMMRLSVVKGRELVDVRHGALSRVQRQKFLTNLASEVTCAHPAESSLL